MKRSDSLKELTKSFILIQKEIEPAKKDAINPHFRSKYSTLASCYEACSEILSKNNVWVCQVPWTENGDLYLTTVLSHSSGEYVEGSMFVCPKDTPSQTKGSAISYIRRYSLITMVGISSEDDDGNEATIAHKPQKPAITVNPKTGEMTVGEHEHKWFPDKFNPGKEYCSLCKTKRFSVKEEKKQPTLPRNREPGDDDGPVPNFDSDAPIPGFDDRELANMFKD